MNTVVNYGWEFALLSEAYFSLVSTRMKEHGLERYFMPFLVLCEHSGNITQKELAEILKRDKVTVMRMVDYFSDRGLLTRKNMHADRRCQLLEVTEKAKKILPVLHNSIEEVNKLFFSELSANDMKQFESSMIKLLQQLDLMPESEYIIHATKRK